MSGAQEAIEIEAHSERAIRREVRPAISPVGDGNLTEGTIVHLGIYVRYLRDKHDLPPEWDLFAWSCANESAPEGFVRLTGNVAPIKSRGKYKGARNWAKRNKANDKTFFAQVSEVEAWAKEKGICLHCNDTLRVCIEWSAKEGSVYRACVCVTDAAKD